MSKEKISIVIPCYNVEKYVEKCIKSIMNQTYSDLEVIVIDDKSTDGTYDVLLKLKKEYNDRFILLQNEKNSGLAYTRNFGVKKATGKYIGFIDSDDYVAPDYYEVLAEKILNDKSDLVVNDIQLVDESGNNIGNVVKSCILDEVSKVSIIDNGLAASACNKLLRKDLLLKYPFLEGKINEDVASIIPIIVHSDKISYTDKAVYNYVQRHNSIQNSKFSEKRFDMFDSIKVCLDRISDDSNYETYRDIILLHQLLEIYIYILIEINDEDERYNLISKFIDKLIDFVFKFWKLNVLKGFIKRHRRKLRPYYYVLIKMLKNGNARKINAVINFKKNFRTNLKKLIGKNNENGKYTIGELERLAKKQSSKKDSQVKVSVVVPNYNYSKFLIRRLYSILSQTEKIYELIILDDKSTDDSRELIDKVYNSLKQYVNIKKVYNEENSGTPFKQWAKGMSLASGDYIWIAEADDYCDKHMLNSLVGKVKEDSEIYIAYVDTAFTDKNGNITLKSIKPEIDIMKTGHWDRDYVNNGLNEIENFTFLNNTIANVSSCIIKNVDYTDVYDEIGKYRQAGDWVFYINVMAKGKVAYIDKIMNYYRVHDAQVTTQMKKEKHLVEIQEIYKYITNKFGTNKFQEEKRKERIEFLKRVWNLK